MTPTQRYRQRRSVVAAGFGLATVLVHVAQLWIVRVRCARK